MAVAGDIVIELRLDDKDMSINVKKAGAVLQQFQGTLNQTAASVKKMEDAHTSMGAKFHRVITTLGMMRFAVMDMNDVFLRLPVAVLKTAGELERMQALMTGLSKATNKAAKEAEGLKNFNFVTSLSKKAPFEIAALADSFVKLKTAGIDPTNGSMVALVDSVARFGGTSESLKRASIAIQQMAGKGVISMEELRQQLGEAVPTAMQDMADGMGVSMAKLADVVKTGTLKTGPAIDKMLMMMQLNNAGAAAEMMKTWTGTLSRLKSEWELSAKFIADSGFGNAAKDAVAELIDVMRTDEFKRFGADTGAALGSAVSSVVSLVQTLVKYREEIILLGQAWIAYKVVFSGIVPLAATLGQTWAATSTQIQGQIRAITNKAAADRASALSTLASISLERTERAAALAAKLAGDRVELASVRAKNEAIIAEQMRASAALAAMQNAPAGKYSGWGSRVEKTAAAEFQARELARQNSTLTASQLALTSAIAGTTAAQAANAVAGGAQVAALQRVAGATALARAGTVAATVASTVFSGAMSLMGGPIGVAIAAVMALVWWYNKAANEAEESADRQRRAIAGLSSAKDAADDRKELGGALDGEKNAIVEAARSRDIKTAERQKEDEKRVEAATANRIRLEARLKLSETAARESSSRDRTNGIKLEVDRTVEAYAQATQKEVLAIQQKNDEVMKAFKGTDDEVARKKKEGTDRALAAQSAGMKVELAARQAAASSLRATALDPKNAADLASNMKAAKDQQDQADELALRIAGNQAKLDSKIEFKEKGGKGGKGGGSDNKYEKFLESLKTKKVKLEAELDGLLSSAGKSDAAVMAIAEVNQRIENGDFNIKGKGKGAVERKPNESESQALRDAAVQNAEMQDLVSDARRVAGEINKMEPDLAHAKKVFADPFGTGEMKSVNRYDEIIAKLKAAPEEFKLFADKMGIEAKNLNALLAKIESGRAAAATIDASRQYQSMADDNRRLGLELIQDDRERARQQGAIAEELAAKRAAVAIDEFTKAKVSADLIDQYRAQVDANAALRAKELALKSRTPIEKLADDWQQSMNKMDDASARWADSWVDMIVSSAKTGKMEFGSFVEAVLADILKIQLQKTMGDPLKNVIGAGTDWLKGALPGMGSNSRGGASDAAAIVAADNARELSRFGEAALRAKDGLTDMATTGVNATTDALVSGLATKGQEMMATGTFTSSIGAATNAIYNFISALQSGGGGGGGSGGGIGGMLSSFFGSGSSSAGGFLNEAGFMEVAGSLAFADGGIMTSMGPVALRKYAAGGIANSPQLALYGEAGPEAYVPLPDGRSIPVTMSGGQSVPSVTVNVINQSGSPVTAQQGQPRFDGKQMILDVVLSAASQPGGFRDGMKGAMR